MDTRIIIENCQDKLAFTEEFEKLVENTVKACIAIENFSLPCEISITITDNEEIKDINNEHRGINKATDVLSFPMTDITQGQYNPDELVLDMDDGVLLLGDIVLSLERAYEQAEEYGHSINRELAFLIAHGMFHLFGYDHMEKNEENIMFSKQDVVLNNLGLKRE